VQCLTCGTLLVHLACVGAGTQPCCHDKASPVPDQRALHHLTCQTRALYEAGSDAPVPCLLPCALQGGGVPAKKGKRAIASQGNLRTVRWPRGSTTTCSYCCTGRLSFWTLWSKSSEFRAGSFVLYSSKPHRCITTNLWACLAADCSLLAAQHPADRLA
jgi:hypothetical protein